MEKHWLKIPLNYKGTCKPSKAPSEQIGVHLWHDGYSGLTPSCFVLHRAILCCCWTECVYCRVYYCSQPDTKLLTLMQAHVTLSESLALTVSMEESFKSSRGGKSGGEVRTRRPLWPLVYHHQHHYTTGMRGCVVFTYGRLRVCGQLVFVCVYIHRAVDWGRWRGPLSKAFLSPSLRFSFHLLPVHVSLQCQADCLAVT